MYAIYLTLAINNDCLLKQHEPADLCKADVWFLWGRNWIFVYYL